MKYQTIIIVIATERGERGECHIGFPSLTFQNPEEGVNKPPKRRFMNKRIHKEKQRGCLLLGANKHTHIYIIYIKYIYTS